MALKFSLGRGLKSRLSVALAALQLLSVSLLVSVSLTPAMAADSPSVPAAAPGTVYRRLPATCQPERYDLYFEPDLETSEFEGTETLFFALNRASDEIVLNAIDLSVFEATVAQTKPTHGDWIKAEILKDAPGEKVTLKLPKALRPGQYELSLKFNGRLSKKMEGFYLSTLRQRRQRIAYRHHANGTYRRQTHVPLF